MQRDFVILQEVVDCFDGDAPHRVGVIIPIRALAVLAPIYLCLAALDKRWVFGLNGLRGVLVG
jgi:hypothetical protein